MNLLDNVIQILHLPQLAVIGKAPCCFQFAQGFWGRRILSTGMSRGLLSELQQVFSSGAHAVAEKVR